MKKISIIIVTYNSEKDIYDCLDSIYQYNDIGDALEVIIVDNHSSEYVAMRETILAQYPDVKIIQNSHNGGYGQGNNIGIHIAQAPIIAIMNPDVRLITPIFTAALDTLNFDDYIMCAGKQMHTRNQAGWSYAFDFTILGKLQVIMRNIYKRFDYYDYRKMHLSGAFFFIKKKNFEEIGLFDENIFMYGEECDIHQRLRKLYPNSKIRFLAKYPYLHLTVTRPFEEKRFLQLLRGDMYVCEKHHLSVEKYLLIRLFAIRICLIRCWLLGRRNNNEAYSYIKMKNIVRQMLKESK